MATRGMSAPLPENLSGVGRQRFGERGDCSDTDDRRRRNHISGKAYKAGRLHGGRLPPSRPRSRYSRRNRRRWSVGLELRRGDDPSGL